MEKFLPGRIVGTPAALSAMEEAGVQPFGYLERHINGDWGDVCEEDRLANENSLRLGLRLLSVYTLPSGQTIWVITEAADEHGKRSATTILLPEDY